MERRDLRGLDPESFDTLRSTVAIAARDMTKEQAFEVVDHVLAALRRRAEARSWPDAREGGTIGFT